MRCRISVTLSESGCGGKESEQYMFMWLSPPACETQWNWHEIKISCLTVYQCCPWNEIRRNFWFDSCRTLLDCLCFFQASEESSWNLEASHIWHFIGLGHLPFPPSWEWTFCIELSWGWRRCSWSAEEADFWESHWAKALPLCPCFVTHTFWGNVGGRGMGRRCGPRGASSGLMWRTRGTEMKVGRKGRLCCNQLHGNLGHHSLGDRKLAPPPSILCLVPLAFVDQSSGKGPCGDENLAVLYAWSGLWSEC